MILLRSTCTFQRTLAILQGALSGRLGEPGREVAGIAESDALRDLADAVIGEDKQFLGLCDAEVDEVIIRCRAHVPPEQPQKIALAHVGIGQKVREGKFLLIIFAQRLGCL